MNKNDHIIQLILAELIKINNRLDKMDEKMDQRFLEVNEHITFIGEKVFDNHEVRINALENKAGG